jgi:hypothetical protein
MVSGGQMIEKPLKRFGNKGNATNLRLKPGENEK